MTLLPCFAHLLLFFFFFFFFFLLLPEIVSGNSEIDVLMRVKAALDPEMRILSSWRRDGDICDGTFLGVECNANGRVTNISLQGRGLTGVVPYAISGLKCLTGLFLHYNSLSGQIPSDISNLTDLNDLYLNVNNLSGSIPPEIGRMGNLQVLQLCCNQLSGKIPRELGSLKKLTLLTMQYNRLTGAIPASLGNLSMLRRLDLSFNQLFSSIPVTLGGIAALEGLDVRNNSLSGSVPLALRRLNDGFQYGNNMGLCGSGFASLNSCNTDDGSHTGHGMTGPDPTALAPRDIPWSANVSVHCSTSNCRRPAKSPAVVILFAVAAVAVGVIIAGLLVFACYRRQKQKIGSALESSETSSSTNQVKESCRKDATLISLDYQSGWDPITAGHNGGGLSQEIFQNYWFNLEEVESATQYFSEVNLLGKSTSAAVYKGILRDGSVVAVKSVSKTSCKSEEAEFLKGLNILMSLQHENLVRFRGFCSSKGRGECFFIYDFAANGTLLQYLDAKEGSGRILDWSTRTSIITGIANGIEYLHSTQPGKNTLVHQSISAQKVMLDHHFKPLLSDCGFHKLLADDVIFSTLKASAAMGYLAPEYTTVGLFSESSDIYAFGVIVFQILSGKQRITRAMCLGSEFDKFEDLVDHHLHGKFSEPEAEKLVKIAVMCTNDIPSERPTAEMVVEELSKCGISDC